MASGAVGVYYTSSFPSSSYFTPKAKTSSSCSSINVRFINSNRIVACSAVQESSTSTGSETKPVEQEAPAKPKPKPAAKAAIKPLPEMMEEEVIPSLKTILKGSEDVDELELSFKDNKLEGSFQKKGIPYSFWAFFPSGDLTGPKGFSLSSYGSEPSTVEPFLIDEKKITAQHVIFWVEKRLAAQGIIPVWTD